MSLLITAAFSTMGTAEEQAPAGGEKAAVSSSSAASKSLPQASADDGRAYPVTEINLRYAREHNQHPDLESILLTVPISFGKVAGGLAAPRNDLPLEVYFIRDMTFEKPVLLYASGIKVLCSAVVADLNRRRLAGVFVALMLRRLTNERGPTFARAPTARSWTW